MVSSGLGPRLSTQAWRTAALGLIGSMAVALSPAALGADGNYVQQGKNRRLVLVELFTSQGCSSCPPADQLQTELADRPDVLALTFPVDYWDYLGWHDTLARGPNSERQVEYSKRSQSGRVFTPQMVIDGVFSAVGSRREDVVPRIASRAMTPLRVPLSIEVKDDRVAIGVPSAPGALDDSDTGKATLWLFPFAKEHVVHIAGGENIGRSVRYMHVVGDFAPLGQWSGAAATFEHTLAEPDRDEFGYAAVLQEDRVGPVIGVAWSGDTRRMHPAPMSPEPAAMADPLIVNIAR